MPRFGRTSQKRLDTCHEDLQKICNEVIKYFDFSILEGTRTLEQQQEYFRTGRSKLDGITKKSKHQSFPSHAVDVAPYPIDFAQASKAKARFYMLAGYFFEASKVLQERGEINHEIRWGGDWDSDKKFEDQSFDDLPHFELSRILKPEDV